MYFLYAMFFLKIFLFVLCVITVVKLLIIPLCKITKNGSINLICKMESYQFYYIIRRTRCFRGQMLRRERCVVTYMYTQTGLYIHLVQWCKVLFSRSGHVRRKTVLGTFD